MNLPTVKQLKYFVALDEKGHFGKAAESCFVSQSAFSVAIKELESHLGAQLVDRTNKNVTITRVGREVANQARHCLRDIEHLAEVARSNDELLSGRLNMGVIPTIAPFVLPSLMPRLRESFPELQLYLREDTTQSIYARLMSGELDVVLLALPYKLSNVETYTLFKDHFLLACHKNTRFLDPDHYDFDSLPDESVLLLEDGHCLRDHALSACKLQNQETVSRFAASSLYTLVEMVDSDIGITYLTDMARESMILKHTDIKTYPIGKQSYRDIGLVWRKGSARGEEFKLLGDVISKMHQELFQERTD
jgi:LysR family hydrogen peroxide-inducible transcriptional activator